MPPREKSLVFDASAFIMGLDPFSFDLNIFTTPKVVKELSDSSFRLRYSTALYMNKLKLISPAAKSEKAIDQASLETGNHLKLSKADRSVLALALELKSKEFDPVIVSDDFSVQNIADHLGIEYVFLSKRGIKTRIQWRIYCPDCRRRFTSLTQIRICPACGTEVKRKVHKRFALKKGTAKPSYLQQD